MEDALERVLGRIGGMATVERLAGLSGSDFTSVMLEVARRRAARETPASVLRRYERDRFVRRGQSSVRAVRRAEDTLLGGLPEDVEVVLLAPLVQPAQGGHHHPGLRGRGRPDQRAGARGRRAAGAGA